VALTWSVAMPPDKDCRYDHVVAETPLCKIVLEWKSWKDYDSPCAHMPWGEFVIGTDLDDAKQKVQAAWDKMVPTLDALCSWN
jgi:hypothetical protein